MIGRRDWPAEARPGAGEAPDEAVLSTPAPNPFLGQENRTSSYVRFSPACLSVGMHPP